MNRNCHTANIAVDFAPLILSNSPSGSHYVSVSFSLSLEIDVIALVLVAAQILLNAKHLPLPPPPPRVTDGPLPAIQKAAEKRLIHAYEH